MSRLEFDDLAAAVRADAAVRCRFHLTPAGGAGDKVRPPTYGDGRYAVEIRRLDGEDVPCVVLDSVASQANRMESALFTMVRQESLSLPIVSVRLEVDDDGGPREITSLTAPHRIYDAILRDSRLDGVAFPDSDLGRAIHASSPDDATAMFASCPTALLFGAWHSTGRRGGRGQRFPRLVVSEVVGINARAGVATRSRLDPLDILSTVPVYACDKEPGWTTDPRHAVKDRGKPVLFPMGAAADRAGRASLLNHSSVTPTIEEKGGGVTIDRAEQTCVLSLAGLRRLRFPVDGEEDLERSVAARTVLALIGMLAVVAMQRDMSILRSRCMLSPAAPPKWEVLDAMGGAPRRIDMDVESLRALLDHALEKARRLGLPWNDGQVDLTPSPELLALVAESRRRRLDRFAATPDGNGD